MRLQNFIAFYLVSLLVLLLVSNYQSAPGYMDADYYLMTGSRLANGLGFTEEVLWNFLDDPSGLPHPSHAYWMPLPSLVAASGIKLLGGLGLPLFETGKILFILVAAAISPFTAALSWKLTGERKLAFFSGTLAMFPGFYLAFLPTTDTFALGMVLGAVFFLVIQSSFISGPSPSGLLLLGAITGLLHLNRAEGFIWIVIAAAALIASVSWRKFLWLVLGYTLVFGPWMVRNQLTFGSLFPPEAGRTLWLTEYDQLFAYPASQLNLQSWLSGGFGEILRARVDALWLNLQTAFAVQGGVFLAPLIVLGAWRRRKVPAIRWAGIAWALLLLIMTILFPFPGGRGGFFHAAAALQPVIWALAAIGLAAAVDIGVQKRGWRSDQSFAVLGSGAILILLGLSLFLIRQRVIGADFADPIWGDYFQRYERLGEAINSFGFNEGTVAMVNNPPGFHLATGLPAISVPNGDLEISLQAARHYRATLLLLEENHPAGLELIYNNPQDFPGITYVASISGAHIFQIDLP